MGTSQKYKEYKSIEDLPAMIRVKELASYMGINQNKAYELVKRDNFPSLKLGQRIMIPKEHFKKWINSEVVSDERSDEVANIFRKA